ncbi:MAG: hypothetical protein U0452_05660 [Anaerolineae bacterium]
MNDIPLPVSLNAGWTVHYDEPREIVYAFAELDAWLPFLSAFVCKGRMAWLSRTFDVPPILDQCLRFDLHITAAPGRVVLTVNGQMRVAVDGTRPFVFDVTDFITLEDNILTLQVDCAGAGSFGDVFLKAEPCGP